MDQLFGTNQSQNLEVAMQTLILQFFRACYGFGKATEKKITEARNTPIATLAKIPH